MSIAIRTALGRQPSGLWLPKRTQTDPHPAAAGSTFVDDTFTGTDGTTLASHTGETGATWTQHASSASAYQIFTNRIRNTTNNAVGLYYASGVPTTAEYDVIGDIFVASLATTDVSGIAGRLATAANTMIVGRYSSTTTVWQLANVSAGTLTVLQSGPTVTLTVGATYSVRLAIRDNFKGLYVDGVLHCSSTDNTITAAGRAGFRGFCSTNADASGLQYTRLRAINA